jgi:hypothetical protein
VHAFGVGVCLNIGWVGVTTTPINYAFCVMFVSRFFVQFGSFIKIQLNLDLSVQPALVL